jgi:hypothetical protein
MQITLRMTGLVLWGLLGVGSAQGASPRERVAVDREEGRHLVAHVVVALCDSAHQGVVPPTPASLGDGQDPKKNLYWGALYGVQTHLLRNGWTRVTSETSPPDGVLERLVVSREVAGRRVFLVADAWDGRRMRGALQTFLAYLSGRDPVRLSVDDVSVQAGGASHLIAFVGHNGLMDMELPDGPAPREGALARAGIVLACVSRPYFAQRIRYAGAEPLLLTQGLMAPEAYTLDAAVQSFFSGEPESKTREAAAQAYHEYQKCGLKGARWLFAPGE